MLFLFTSLLILKFTIAIDPFENHIVADKNGTYHIFWKLVNETITFELQVATKGYVGFGFSPNGGMPGSDVIIGWVLPDGTCTLQDRYAIGFFEPRLDKEQNYQLINCYENNTHTVLRFSRLLNTCDKENDTVILDNTMKIIYSWHTNDPKDPTKLSYHGSNRRGSRDTYLISAPPPPIEITDDIVIWDVQMPNTTIPAQRTTYWCITFKLPPLDGPHEYIGYSVLITPGNENLVHHFTLWECLGNSSYFENKVADTAGSQCFEEGTLNAPFECQPPIIIWAVGSSGQSLPKGIGVPVGEEYGGPTYFLMQMHYDNVQATPGIVDSSILRVYLTKKPQPISASMLQISVKVDYRLVIPPKQNDFPITSFCTSECTNNHFPEEGVKIFAVGLHTHLAGRKLSLRHFRDNKELKPITIDNNYNFNFQKMRTLREHVTVLPGDMLMGTCVYSTMDRNESVVGGYGTDREMCFIYMSYYPSTKLSMCSGGTAYKNIFDYFGIEQIGADNLHIKSPVAHEGVSMFDFEIKYDWSNVTEDKLRKLYSMQYEEIKTFACVTDPKFAGGITMNSVIYPANASFYVPEDNCKKTCTNPTELP